MEGSGTAASQGKAGFLDLKQCLSSHARLTESALSMGFAWVIVEPGSLGNTNCESPMTPATSHLCCADRRGTHWRLLHVSGFGVIRTAFLGSIGGILHFWEEVKDIIGRFLPS